MRRRFAALTLAIALTSGTSPAGAGWEIDHCWGEHGTEPGEFRGAFGIAVDDDGLVYVTDFRRNDIQVFGADGGYLATWSTGSAPGMEFDRPVGLEFEYDRLYVMNRGLCKLHVMGTDCSVLGEWWSCGLLQWGHRIAVGADLVCMEINGASGGLRVFDRGGTPRPPVRLPPKSLPTSSAVSPRASTKRFGAYLKDRFSHVRIQYRTPTQLGLLERYHRTLKEEEVYWQVYENPSAARRSLDAFRTRYNEERPHWALVPAGGGDPLVPAEVYAKPQEIGIPKWQGWAVGAKAKLDEMMSEAS